MKVSDPVFEKILNEPTTLSGRLSDSATGSALLINSVQAMMKWSDIKAE